MRCVVCRKLEKATGWRTLNLGYPSRSQPLDSLAKGVAAEIVHEVGPGGQVFLVTHSLGGIVFRHIVRSPCLVPELTCLETVMGHELYILTSSILPCMYNSQLP